MTRTGEREPRVLLERQSSGAELRDRREREEVEVRLAAVGAAFAAVWAIGLVLFDLVGPILGGLSAGRRALWPFPGTAIALTGVSASLALIWLARRGTGRPVSLARAGAGFMVFTCFLLGLLSFWSTRLDGVVPAWIGVVILGYAGIVPDSPRSTRSSALLAATMAPLAAAVAALAGAAPRATGFELLVAFVPNYLCAALAVAHARLIRRLGRRLQEARELGSYRLEQLLSRGGMGEVHRASHRTLARPAAVKLIRTERVAVEQSPAARVLQARFRREAEAVASLRSPHTVSLYDYGVARDGRHFLVMELLDGLDLESLVRRHGPVAPARAIHFLRQACASLAEAHARGMIHRDIKPSNLFACRLGLEVDFLKVLDFGLVREPEQEDVRLTAPDRTAGTPAYMAPEMIVPREPVDHRADIYGLGCVAYWLLTGEPVFRGDSTVDLLLQHAHSAPVPPSERGRHRIPPRLEAVVMACLAKSPAGRPATARDLSLRLEACLRGIPGWSDADAQHWWRLYQPEASPAGEVPTGPAGWTAAVPGGKISAPSPEPSTEPVLLCATPTGGASSRAKD